MRSAVLVCLLALAVGASVQPFKQGQTYTYRFRTQVASSLLADDPSMIQQQAATGMQAQLKLTFGNDHFARVQLQHVRLGEMNGQTRVGQQQMIPSDMFEKRTIPEEMKSKLEEPFTVRLVDGVVDRIQFSDDDELCWSKNIKRAAMNMLQLNLERNDVQGLMKQSSQPLNEQEQRKLTVFTIPEITLEGECEVVYTIQRRNTQYRDEEESREQQGQTFNVTKNVDFTRCRKTADISYGFQPNPAQQLRCHKCLKQTEVTPKTVGKTEQQEKLKYTLCQQECQTNQLTNNKNIERSTVAQFELHGNTQKYGIRRSQIISQYVVKGQNPEAQNTISQVVSISELVYQQDGNDSPVPTMTQTGKDSTLLYEPTWDMQEKRFYMWGDEEFEGKRITPFAKVQGKSEKSANIVREILKQWNEDKEMGYELNTAMLFNKLVQLVRQSTTHELKEIEQRVVSGVQQFEGREGRQEREGHQGREGRQGRERREGREEREGLEGREEYGQNKHAKTLFLDALAVAATQNSIKYLLHKIKENSVESLKAAQLIKVFIANQHSPSDRQVDILEKIATSETAQRCPILKQAAWLSYGSAIGAICQQRPGQSQRNLFRQEELCPEAKKEQYKKTLLLQWKQANTIYEQILALKVIGNSALEKCMPELEKIIIDRLQPTLIRMESIDALRRMRTSQPEKIQQILMPIFQNQREQPEIRMAAVSMILYTQPSVATLDQIAFSIIVDRSQNVKSFVLTALESLSKSPVSAERQAAQHLKAVLKVVKVTPEQIRASRKYRVPVYVSEQEYTEEQTVFLGLASIISPANLIPVHLASSIRAAFNGDATQEKLQLSFTQKDLDVLYEKLSNVYDRYQDSDENDVEGQERQSAKDLNSIYSSLGIKSRRAGYVLSSEESESSENNKRSSKSGNNSPFGMLVLRANDQDRFLIPIDEMKVPQMVRKFLDGGKPSFNSESYEGVLSHLREGKKFQQHIAMNIGESKVKLPTTSGLPLAIIWQTSAMLSLEGKVQAEVRLSQMKVDGQLKLRTSAIATHMHKTEVWTPSLVSGVQTMRTVEINHNEIKIKVLASNGEFKLSIIPPTKEQKERVLGLHTLPATYTQSFNWAQRTYGEARLRTVRNYALESQQHEFHGLEEHQQCIRVEGNIHKVQTLKQLLSALYTTENNVHVFFKPGPNTPEELSLRITGSAFRRSERGEHKKPEFDDFYSQQQSSRKHFRSIYDDAEEQDEYKQMQFHNNKQREERLSGFVSKYQSDKAYKHHMRIELEARTPAKSHKAELHVQATCDDGLQHCKAILNAQRTPFAHESENWQLQAKVQTVLPETVRGEQSPEDKMSRMVVKLDCEWGQGQKVHVRLQGEPTRKTYWRSDSSDKWSRFLNKYDLIVDYQMGRPQCHAVERVYEMTKAMYFWHLETKPERKGDQHTIRATLVIDPMSGRQANLTVQTPTELIRAQNIELPIRVNTYTLERRQSSYHSFGQLVQSFSQQGSAECRADDRRIRTFDGVAYRAPLSECWTVLAKDCRENPRFAVLMRKTNGVTAVKIITRENTLVLEKQQSKDLIVKIDGERVNDEEKLSEQGIEKDDNEVYVKQSGIEVRFDGQEAKVKVSRNYKNIQCGLCGHHDDEESNDFVDAGGKRSSLKAFHQSYTLKNQECDGQKFNKFYEDNKSNEFQVKSRKQQSAYYRSSSRQQQDDDSNSNEQWLASSEEDKENDEKNKPVERTQVLEYAQKVCFSMKPVKKCPQGTVPSNSSESKSTKVQFFCLERSSTQARRLQRQVRQGKVIESQGHKPSFFDNVDEPVKCQSAEFY